MVLDFDDGQGRKLWPLRWSEEVDQTARSDGFIGSVGAQRAMFGLFGCQGCSGYKVDHYDIFCGRGFGWSCEVWGLFCVLDCSGFVQGFKHQDSDLVEGSSAITTVLLREEIR